jgi:hypothetical protein
VKLKMSRRNKSLFLVAIMLFMTVASSLFSRDEDNTPQDNTPQFDYIDTWQGMNVYEQKTRANTSIYYLELQPGYRIVMRADPREAEKVESPSGMIIYSVLYTSSSVYAVFDPADSKEINLAYTELAKFLTNRPFELVFATTEPYTDDINRTYPYVDPFNTTEDEAVIYLKISNETKLELVNRTVIVHGTDMWNLTTAGAKLELILMRLI